MENIKLSLAEIQVASQVGIQRQLEDIKAKKKSFAGEKQDAGWQRHIEGALTECAMAKYLNVYWNKQKWNLPDVGEVEIRSTSYENGCLILRPNDADDKKYYLLVGVNGEYKICGYLYGRDGKQDKYLTNMGGRVNAYFVPQSELKI